MKKKIYIISSFLCLHLLLFNQIYASETIKIASIFAKTGEAAGANVSHLQAVRFAVDELNVQGGIVGKKIELLEFDNQSTPTRAKLAARKAIKARVTAVIGASWSSHSIAMAPLFQKAKIPMISPDSTNPAVTKKGDYIFRACFIDPFQGEVLAKFSRKEFQAQTAVIMTKITSAYSIGLAEMFEKHFVNQQGKILREFEYQGEDRNFELALTQTKILSPDILFIPGHDESGFIVKQAQKVGIKAKMLGGDGWGYERFMEYGGQELNSGYYTAHWSPEVDSPQSQDFVKRYSQVYPLSEFAAVTYDAVMLLADAIRRVGSLEKEKIRMAIAGTRNFQGVTGTIDINENGDAVKSAVVMKVANGKAEYYKSVNP